MNDDHDLLRDFALRRDQASFRRLVERRIGFVYAVTLRRLRDPHLAQDATQAVFVALARKAARVAEGPSVMGWLHRSSCYESRNLLRARANRLARETEAERLGTTTGANEAPRIAGALEAVLDEVLNELPEADRDALLARYFSNQSYAEIGAVSGRSDNAVRMRVERALIRLRDHLRARGFESTAAVLASALPAYAGAAIPTGLAANVASTALATLGSAASITFLTMSTTKITVAAAAAASIASFAGFEMHRNRGLEEEMKALRRQQVQSLAQIEGLEKQVVELKARPAVAEAPAARNTAAPIAAPIAVAAAPTPEVTRGAPQGWLKNGSKTAAFDVGVDATETWGGMPSAYAKSISGEADKEFGGMMQTIAAERYRNQRVRLSGWMKTKDAEKGANLWLRVDGQARGVPLAFDNMDDRAPKGTSDWAEYSVVLDVPATATTVNYGFFLKGQGHAWVNALRIEPVGNEVPTTDMHQARQRQLPNAPTNLGFADSGPRG